MNFRIFASGLVLIVVYQLAIAAVVVWFVMHCETARGETACREPAQGCESAGMTAGSCE